MNLSKLLLLTMYNWSQGSTGCEDWQKSQSPSLSTNAVIALTNEILLVLLIKHLALLLSQIYFTSLHSFWIFSSLQYFWQYFAEGSIVKVGRVDYWLYLAEIISDMAGQVVSLFSSFSGKTFRSFSENGHCLQWFYQDQILSQNTEWQQLFCIVTIVRGATWLPFKTHIAPCTSPTNNIDIDRDFPII